MEISLQPFLILIAFSLWLHLNAGFVRSLYLKDQQSSLLKFKQTLIFNPALSSKLVSWVSSIDCCSWPGVTCSGSGHVIGLDLSNESISGGIDSPSSLFDLHHLQSLNLALNRFNGTRIPSGLDKLANLRHLNLSYAEFNGQIPAEISGLTRLVSLDISMSRDPHSFYFYAYAELKLENPNLSMLVRNLTRLRELHLQGTNISVEGREWCRALSSLPRLRVLNLADCLLSGPIDSSLANLRLLSVIQLSFNQLSAPVPEFLGNFLNLASLHLRGCDLYGKFPAKVFQLPTLQSLDISGNPLLQGFLPEFPENGSLQILMLESTNFSGMMPSSIGNLKMLSTMKLSSCNFSRSIPNSIGSLANLIHLDLSDNWFSGSIPSFSMLKDLVDLDLSHNNLSGQISSTNWGNLSNLVNLQLYENSLEGVIPSSLFSLPSLQRIDLSNNGFSGQICNFLAVSSSQLVVLDLSNNRLNGPIPSSFFKLQGLMQLILSSNNFNGTLELSIIQKLGNLSVLALSFNDLLVDDGFGNIDLTRFPQLGTLHLASCKLRKFPSFLRNQSEIFNLDLSDNQIQGEIPNWICELSWSNLNLSHNLLTKIEGSLRNLSFLQTLDLHSNQLRGDISNIPQHTEFIDHSENQFNSVIPAYFGSFLRGTGIFLASGNYLHGVIPEAICSEGCPEILDLSRNSLNGTVPWGLINAIQNNTIRVLNLRRNKLSGTIPDAFPRNCGLQTLNFNENFLKGKIPKSLANCKMLEVLDVGNNGINDSFPCWLSIISSLRVLILRFNKFYGSIECPVSNETNPLLQIVDLGSNKFSGNLPETLLNKWTAMMVGKDQTQVDYLGFDVSWYQFSYKDVTTITNKGIKTEFVKILTIITFIDFSCNSFEGKIPEVIGEFTALYSLNLSHNFLTGPIPSSLGNLQQLESLDLSTNNLRGEIPQQLGCLNFLEVLNLSHNQLEGRIPKGNQLQTFSEESFKDNKGLCGTPLMDCGATMQPQSEGKNSDNGAKIDWNLISAEVGFVFGLAIVILPLMFWKSWRLWYYQRVDSVLCRILPQLNQRSRNNGQRALKAHKRRN